MFPQLIILFIKNAYAGTGSAQDSGLLFLSAIIFFSFILILIYIYEQIRKFIDRFQSSSNPDIENDNSGSAYTEAV